MTRKEYLLEKYQSIMDSAKEKAREFYSNPVTARMEPFQIADQVYYVGDTKVCVHLIDTGDGLILLDSGYFGTAHMLIDSIWRIGFDPADVKWILHSHGHHDHFGSSEVFRNMYGTKLAISKVDAECLRQLPRRDAIRLDEYPFAKLPEFDYEIEDGEVFELGNIKIRCVLTPGHTDGVLSFFFDVTYQGETYLAGAFGGAGVRALELQHACYNEREQDPVQQMLDSLELIWDEPVVVHLANHPWNNEMLQKREKQLAEGGNPFIAPDSWHNFLAKMKASTEKTRAKNDEMEKEMESLGLK